MQKAANPLSDEEGEDLVIECKRTSKGLFGKTVFVAKLYPESDYIGQEICRAPTYQEALVCFKKEFPAVEIK